VLQRLQTAAPASHADGCRCLDSDTPEVPEPLYVSPIPQKGKAMQTSTLEPLTILAPALSSEHNSAGEAGCGCDCGCGASLTQRVLPQDLLRHTEDHESAPPTRS
jgi:hypothetical protein